MICYSTNGRSPEVSFATALLKGLAPDGGLYMPRYIPKLTDDELIQLRGARYHEIAGAILSRLIGDEVQADDLMRLCADAYNFEVPFEKAGDNKYIMRLDGGPTASFKDFAARMMSRLMQHFLNRENRTITILTATSGDTGSAVASAFYGLANIRVIILYPAGEVSDIQRRQMTTLHKNITVIAVDGKFDDCQKLVKQAFMDRDLEQCSLSSANSINIGRLLPQSVYYFHAWSSLSTSLNDRITFSVPSGNFGNLMGGVIAREMGLPVGKFIIATNENDEVPGFLRTSLYSPVEPSKNCISSAMNVGHPSNLARLVALYGGNMDEKGNMPVLPDIDKMRNDFYATAVTDNETRESMAEAYTSCGVILEPHGAVAWAGLNRYITTENISSDTGNVFVSVETAHPAKFPEEVSNVIDIVPVIPASLAGLEGMEEKYFNLNNNYLLLKEFILDICIKNQKN